MILEIAKNQKVDLLAISGDVFDANSDLEDLRSKVSNLFSDIDFDVVLVAGNHDCAICKEMYFGTKATVVASLDKPFEKENVTIWGLPFEDLQDEEIIEKLECLRAHASDKRSNILLYHGELLDASFKANDFGDEAGNCRRYMPLKLSYFEGLPIEYVLGGHFHTSFGVRPLPNGGFFVYPGSPVSITRKETGQRSVNIFEVGQKPSQHFLDTFHYADAAVTLDPFSGKNPLDIIREAIAQKHPASVMTLTVRGFLDCQALGMSEAEFAAAANQAAKGKCSITFQFKNVQRILADDLFKSYAKKLDQRGIEDQEKKEMLNLAVRAMMEAQH
jgi:DNA repair exonuclease SbcCD nuclease subunit